MPPIRIIFAIHFLTVEKYRYGPLIDPLAVVAQVNNKFFIIFRGPDAAAAEMYFRRINITQQGENSAI